MKKLVCVLVAVALFVGGATPATADITSYDSQAGWETISYSPENSLSVSGSIMEGGKYRVTASLNCPAGYFRIKQYALAYVGTKGDWLAFSDTMVDLGQVSLTSPELTAGAPGTTETFGTFVKCMNQFVDGQGYPEVRFRAKFLRVTFESNFGTPSNFSVFPQAAGSAFTTWGVVDGATSYTVTAAPGGRSCTTTANFCTITGLTNGETYTFTLAATNGTASTSVGSGPVLMRQPVNVAVALSGGTWKVGEAVTAQVAVQGQGGASITWYRCDQVVGAMPTTPVGCASVSSGTSTNYTLTSADVGKYITAHVFVNNTDPQGQMTASNNNVVLASNAVAPAPVADPDGKPTIVNIPERIVPVAGGTEIVITGTGLAGVTSVTIGGIPTVVVSKTDTSITVKVPVSGKTGAADVVITNAKGTVTEKGALVYTTAPVAIITKTKSISGFTATQKTLTTSQKAAVKALITANPTLTQLTCLAKTTGVATSSAALAKAKALATATCAYATTVKKSLLVGVSASQSLPKAKVSRTVLLTLKN